MTDRPAFLPINADAVAASIEERQRRQRGRGQQPTEGVTMTIEEQGRPFAKNQRLAEDVIAKRADFEAAVAAGDVSLALARYYDWTDSMHRSTSQGGDAYRDIPPFSVVIDQAATKAAIARRKEP